MRAGGLSGYYRPYIPNSSGRYKTKHKNRSYICTKGALSQKNPHVNFAL